MRGFVVRSASSTTHDGAGDPVQIAGGEGQLEAASAPAHVDHVAHGEQLVDEDWQGPPGAQRRDAAHHGPGEPLGDLGLEK